MAERTYNIVGPGGTWGKVRLPFWRYDKNDMVNYPQMGDSWITFKHGFKAQNSATGLIFGNWTIYLIFDKYGPVCVYDYSGSSPSRLYSSGPWVREEYVKELLGKNAAFDNSQSVPIDENCFKLFVGQVIPDVEGTERAMFLTSLEGFESF